MSSPNAAARRPLIVISLEGFARSSLGCYGCSWNHTPAMDAIAASGCVWDRTIASADDPHSVLNSWFQSNTRWADAWRAGGSVQLLTDCGHLDRHDASCFDHFERLGIAEPLPTDKPADEVSETQFGRLIAAAIERDSLDEPWSVLWIHSRFLTQRWDAPRDLIPVEELDPEHAEVVEHGGDDSDPEELHDNQRADEPWNHGHGGGDEDAWAIESLDELDGLSRDLPAVFDTVLPPEIELALEKPLHPDLITSWMRTYGCQIRLVDLLVEVLLGSLSAEDPWVVVVGTSGFRLGQGGWIGHHVGPLRSPDIHLPMIVSDCGPGRIPQLASSNELPEVLRRIAASQSVVSPEQWSQTEREAMRVATKSDRVRQAITTPGWFYVRDADQQEHLYLKPDDVEDFNDIGRVRSDIVKQLRDGNKEPC